MSLDQAGAARWINGGWRWLCPCGDASRRAAMWGGHQRDAAEPQRSWDSFLRHFRGAGKPRERAQMLAHESGKLQMLHGQSTLGEGPRVQEPAAEGDLPVHTGLCYSRAQLLRDKCIKDLGLGLRAAHSRLQPPVPPGASPAPGLFRKPGAARRSRAPRKRWERAGWGGKRGSYQQARPCRGQGQSPAPRPRAGRRRQRGQPSAAGAG